MRRTRASAARARRARPLRASAIRPCCATPRVTPPEWLFERQFITAVVKLHASRVELFWIKPTTEPLKEYSRTPRGWGSGSRSGHPYSRIARRHPAGESSGRWGLPSRALWARRPRMRRHPGYQSARPPRDRLGYPEEVQVVVKPTHRVLERDMKVPEAVGLGYGWSHRQEEELELVHASWLSHWRPPSSGQCVRSAVGAWSAGSNQLKRDVIAPSFSIAER